MIKKLYPKRKHLAQYSARVDGFSRHLEPRGSERGGRGRRWAEPRASSPHSARGASANLNPARQPRKLSFRDAPDKVPGWPSWRARAGTHLCVWLRPCAFPIKTTRKPKEVNPMCKEEVNEQTGCRRISNLKQQPCNVNILQKRDQYRTTDFSLNVSATPRNPSINAEYS